MDYSLPGCCEYVVFSSAAITLLVGISFWFQWVITAKLGHRYDYLLYYSLFMVFSNFAKLVVILAGGGSHSWIMFALDVVAMITLTRSVDAWARDLSFPNWRWGVALVGIVGAALHRFGISDQMGTMIYEVMLVTLFTLTLFYAAKVSPWYVVALMGLAFVGWASVIFAFVNPGSPVAHSFAVIVKVVFLIAVSTAQYERMHRNLYQASNSRRQIIEIMNLDMELEIGRGRLIEEKPAR